MHGHKVPALGLGTWQLRGAACRDSVEEALDLGYRHIDTAQMYGNEDVIGEVLQRAGVDRAELFLTTKLDNRNHAAQAVIRSTERGLSDLRTEYVDLLLIHWPTDYHIVDETLDAMMQLCDDGKVRHIGVSNFSTEQFREAAEQAPIFTNQIEYHPLRNQDALVEAARMRGAMLTAYSPLARGRVTREPALVEIAAAHGKTAAQVSLRWLLQQEMVSAIPKARGRAHLQANMAIFDFELSDEECQRIRSIAG
ncbi:MAG TPA: aldo/keto reductase [Egibacteraceae bacterium]|nr:aldo/keto reductase [Egibacteraceae bacterium]